MRWRAPLIGFQRIYRDSEAVAGRSFLYRKDVNGFDDELDGVADFQVEILKGFGGEDGSHLCRDGDLELHKGHDFVAGDGGDFAGEFIASACFHEWCCLKAEHPSKDCRLPVHGGMINDFLKSRNVLLNRRAGLKGKMGPDGGVGWG